MKALRSEQFVGKNSLKRTQFLTCRPVTEPLDGSLDKLM